MLGYRFAKEQFQKQITQVVKSLGVCSPALEEDRRHRAAREDACPWSGHGGTVATLAPRHVGGNNSPVVASIGLLPGVACLPACRDYTQQWSRTARLGQGRARRNVEDRWNKSVA